MSSKVPIIQVEILCSDRLRRHDDAPVDGMIGNTSVRREFSVREVGAWTQEVHGGRRLRPRRRDVEARR